MKKFQMRAAAVAVSAALGAAAPLHRADAVTLGEPGGALLVPFTLYDSSGMVNTLVGVITSGDANNQGTDPFNQAGYTTDSYWTAGYQETTELCNKGGSSSNEGYTTDLHYYFFDATSIHRGDRRISASCNDFVRLDWGNLVKKYHPSLDGVPGYLVISTEYAHEGFGAAGGSVTSSGEQHEVLYGAAYLIQGNWASEAYIPVYPLKDGHYDTSSPYCGGFPAPTVDCTDIVRGFAQAGVPLNPLTGTGEGAVSPLVSGIQLDNNDADLDAQAVFSLRYFADSVLGGSTTFVVWLDHNNKAYSLLPVDVYDSHEVPTSTTVGLPFQLNLIEVPTDCNIPAGGKAEPLGPYLIDGICHVDPACVDPTNPTQCALTHDGGVGDTVTNTGFVVFRLPEQEDYTICASGGGKNPLCSSADVTVSGPVRAGVAFSLVFIGAGANPLQVQTELAHERGIVE
jgi:hypothetical protein